MSESTRFAPCGNIHSIEHVAFGIDIEAPLSPITIAEIHEHSDDIMYLLPICIREKANLVRMPLPPFVPDSSPRVVDSGLILADNLDYDKAEKYSYVGDGIHIVYKKYDGWSSTLNEIKKILIFLLCGRHITIRNIFLECKDAFIETDKKSNSLDYKCIFKLDSGYIPNNMGRIGMPWRNTFAVFAEIDENDKESIRFDEIDTEYLIKQKNDKDYVSCKARHTFLFYPPRKMRVEESEENTHITMLDNVFSKLYHAHMEILESILTEQAAKCIGLDKRSKP
jgi:hypothetical protein